MVWLRNAAFYGAFYSGSIVFTLLALATYPFSSAISHVIVRGWSGFHRWCVVHLLGCEVVIDGILPNEPVLFAIKHESFFEAIDMPYLLRMPSVFAKQELFSIPFWGKAARAYGLIPVERQAGARTLRTMIREAKEMVAAGRPLVIFPEGGRVPHGTAPPLQSGFAGLYKMMNLPVVPVAINSGPAYHRRWKRTGRIVYRVGQRIEPGLPRDDIELQVRDAINALNTKPEGALP